MSGRRSNRREHHKTWKNPKGNSGTTDLGGQAALPQILYVACTGAGALFQQLYGFVDTVIVGRCLGTDAGRGGHHLLSEFFSF